MRVCFLHEKNKARSVLKVTTETLTGGRTNIDLFIYLGGGGVVSFLVAQQSERWSTVLLITLIWLKHECLEIS